MLLFDVTIPTTVPQGSEIPEGLMNNAVYAFAEESIQVNCTVTTEKAAKHIVTSKISKWPHRETFSASSIFCTYL
jgi:hypothetical protein